MAKVTLQPIAIILLIASLATPILSRASNALEDKAPETIESAKVALENAKIALQSAQDSLEATQSKDPVSKTPSAPLNTRVTSNRNSTPGKLYKWVDEQGNISYQDSPPPKNVKVLNADVLKDFKSDHKKVKELRRANAPDPVFDGSQPVMVYTADNCKPCQSVVLFLTQQQVPFIERDIRDDRHARDRLAKQSKQITVPSLFIGTQIIQSHSEPTISLALRKAGYLK